jgi:hypothetical protein
MKAANLNLDRMLTCVVSFRQLLSKKEVGRELLWNRYRWFVQLCVRQ